MNIHSVILARQHGKISKTLVSVINTGDTCPLTRVSRCFKYYTLSRPRPCAMATWDKDRGQGEVSSVLCPFTFDGRRDPKEGGRSLFIQIYPDVPWQVFASKPYMRFLTFPAMSKTPAIQVAAGCLLASDGSTSTTLKLRSIALRPGCDWPGTCLVMLGKSKTGLQCHINKPYVSRHSKETIRVPNQYASSTLSWTFA